MFFGENIQTQHRKIPRTNTDDQIFLVKYKWGFQLFSHEISMIFAEKMFIYSIITGKKLPFLKICLFLKCPATSNSLKQNSKLSLSFLQQYLNKGKTKNIITLSRAWASRTAVAAESALSFM